MFSNNSYSSKDDEIKNLKEELNKTKIIVEKQKNKIKELEEQINYSNDNIADIVQSFEDQMDKKDKELNRLKKDLEEQLDKKDKELNKLRKDLENQNIKNIKQETIIKESDIATVYFTSSDQRINFAVPCVKKIFLLK